MASYSVFHNFLCYRFMANKINWSMFIFLNIGNKFLISQKAMIALYTV